MLWRMRPILNITGNWQMAGQPWDSVSMEERNPGASFPTRNCCDGDQVFCSYTVCTSRPLYACGQFYSHRVNTEKLYPNMTLVKKISTYVQCQFALSLLYWNKNEWENFRNNVAESTVILPHQTWQLNKLQYGYYTAMTICILGLD